MVSPLRTHEVLIGKMLPPLLIGVVHITLYVLAATLIFQVPLRGSLALLYLSGIVYLGAVVGLGLFISSLSATQQQAILGSFLFITPAVLLSGFATPIENMPGWLQVITYANPLRYFLVIVRGVFLKALPAAEILRNTLPLLAIAVITLSAAAWLFRRRME
jgi:ABC-2 type transport system permease protein